VNLIYLPLYSPELNPIDEVFAELKNFLLNVTGLLWSYPDQGFDAFLTWCIAIIRAKEESAKGHFRHAGLKIEEVPERP
jgi:transposase